MFAAAAGRLIAQHRAAAEAAAAPDAGAAAAATAQQVRAAMHNMLRVALRPLLAAQHAPSDSPPQARDSAPAAASVCTAVPALLLAPGFAAALPPEVRRQLSSGRGLERCCRWLLLLSRPPAERQASSPASTVLSTCATMSGMMLSADQPPMTAASAQSAMRNLSTLSLQDGPSTVGI